MNSCGAFCAHCGKCGRTFGDDFRKFMPKDVTPPGQSVSKDTKPNRNDVDKGETSASN